jgi:hypothetical protein
MALPWDQSFRNWTMLTGEEQGEIAVQYGTEIPLPITGWNWSKDPDGKWFAKPYPPGQWARSCTNLDYTGRYPISPEPLE